MAKAKMVYIDVTPSVGRKLKLGQKVEVRFTGTIKRLGELPPDPGNGDKEKVVEMVLEARGVKVRGVENVFTSLAEDD